jgi:hypothetical protein
LQQDYTASDSKINNWKKWDELYLLKENGLYYRI